MFQLTEPDIQYSVMSEYGYTSCQSKSKNRGNTIIFIMLIIYGVLTTKLLRDTYERVQVTFTIYYSSIGIYIKL